MQIAPIYFAYDSIDSKFSLWVPVCTMDTEEYFLKECQKLYFTFFIASVYGVVDNSKLIIIICYHPYSSVLSLSIISSITNSFFTWASCIALYGGSN